MKNHIRDKLINHIIQVKKGIGNKINIDCVYHLKCDWLE